MRPVPGLVALLILSVAGLLVFIRLAPDDPGRWHGAVGAVAGEGPDAGVRLAKVPGGAVGFYPAADPGAALARLAQVARATPRCSQLAGGLGEGRITGVARSRLIGFPDYITAEAVPGGLRLWSRQRYGRRDFGVNRDRLAAWLAQL